MNKSINQNKFVQHRITANYSVMHITQV